MQFVSTDQAPQPRGHYSQAVVQDGLVFTAGQLPFDPVTGTVTGTSIEEQTLQALKNIKSVLRAAGHTALASSLALGPGSPYHLGLSA